MALRILLADDSMTAQKMGKDILAGAGYEVTAVSNGAAAAKKLADKPDVVILDVYMPGYTGLEICEKIRANMDTASTPVILTVGKMEPWNPQDGQKVKADGVIIKPFEAQDLLAAVQKLEKKLADSKAKEEPAYEKTMIFKAPQVEEFKDESYNDWKSDASSDVAEFEAPPAPAMQMTQEEASAPAFADMFGESAPAEAAPAPAFTAPTPAALDETATFTEPPVPVPPDAPTEALKNAAAATGFDETVRYAHPVIQQVEPPPAPVMEAAPALAEAVLTPIETASFSAMLEPTPVQLEPANLDPVPGSDPMVEFTSAPKAAGVKTSQAAELEVEPDTSNVSLGKDPALATDPTDIHAFTTKFAQDPPAEAQPVEAAAPESDEDFEARVAAAAAAFEQPAEEAAPVVAAEPEPAPVEEAPKYERTMIMDASELAAIRKKVAEAQAAKQAETALVPVQAEPETTTVEPISELTPEPVMEVEATPEPVIDTTPEPVIEATVEPIIERTSEPVVELTPEPMVAADPELITSPSMEIEHEIEHNDPQAPPSGMQDAALVEQMQAAVAEMPVIEHVEEPEPIVAQETAPVIAAAVTEAPTTGGQDLELAKALGAAVGADAPPMEKAIAAAAASSGAAAGLEASAVAQVVHKVLERMLPNIVSEVTREIDQLKK